MAKGKVLTPLTPLKFKNIRLTGEFINIDEINDNVVYVGHIEQNFGSTIGIPVSVIPGGTYDVVATFACGTWRIQLVMSMYNGNIIRRTYYQNTWHEWAKVNMTTVGGVISKLLLSGLPLGGPHEWESEKKFYQEQVYIADKYRQSKQQRGRNISLGRRFCSNECTFCKYKRSNDSAPDRHWKYATCIFNVIARNKSTLKNIQHMEELGHRTTVLESGEAVYAA